MHTTTLQKATRLISPAARHRFARRLQGLYPRFIAACSAVAAVLCLAGFALLACNADKGLDITDRSFYLLWAQQPEHVTGSITHFGFLTRELYRLAGQDIALFRLTGLCVLLALCAVLGRALLQYCRTRPDPIALPKIPAYTVSLAGGLLYYQAWLQAPSYNWVALCGAVLTFIGLLDFGAASGRRQRAAAVCLVAVGGAAAFIGKPTTAMALAGLATAWLLWHRPTFSGAGHVGAAGLLAGGLLAAFGEVYFASAAAYLHNLRFGHELAQSLDGGHSIAALLTRGPTQIGHFLQWIYAMPFVRVFAGLVLGAAAWAAATGHHGLVRVARIVFPALCLAAFSYWAWAFFNTGSGLYIGTILLATVILLAGQHLFFLLPGVPQRPPKALVPTAFFAAGFTLAIPFGTGSDIVRRATESGIFLALAILLLLAVPKNRAAGHILSSIFNVFFLAVVFGVLLNAYATPYRLPGGIKQQTVATSIGPHSQLEVDPLTAEYIQNLRETAENAGWRPGTPLIDLTGGSPGALVILQARILGTPWLLGNYPGSNAFTRKALKSVPPEIRTRAWVLDAPSGERRIAPQVLQNVGLLFPQQYQRVGECTTGHRREDQVLWAPKAQPAKEK